MDTLRLGISVGTMTWMAQGDRLEAIHLERGLGPESPSSAPRSGVLREALFQWQHYLKAPDHCFDLPLAFPGTPFQQQVFAALREIPPGTVWTYGDLARVIGSAPRAVAGALRRNPYPVVVPCHRIVAVGHLGGYCGAVAGPMMTIKRWLLRHEGVKGILSS